jgi:hypothetical protein
MSKWLAIALFCTGAFWPASSKAEQIVFQCRSDQSGSYEKAPITITVDDTSKTASRNDSGLSYRLIKLSLMAVWMLVDDPGNHGAAAIQMIQRSSIFADASAGGRWIEFTINLTGRLSRVRTGLCWEQSS